MADMTRPLNSAPYLHTPGAEPPLHATASDPATESARDSLSRVTGMDADPLANADSPVGIQSWNGDDQGYVGKDLTDPQTWGARPYNEAPGMMPRLQQEAQMGQ